MKPIRAINAVITVALAASLLACATETESESAAEDNLASCIHHAGTDPSLDLSFDVCGSPSQSVAEALSPEFLACYRRGLASDPEMGGTLTLEANLSARGEVSSVDVKARDGVSGEVAACLADAMLHRQFVGTGAPVILRVPVVLRRKQ
jgi:hypothetical protein